MADISITQIHELPPIKARAAAQKVADQMAAEYDMASEWKGNMLLFRRSGVSGTLMLHETKAQLDITLGFLLKAFKARIEEQVMKKMKKVFSHTA